MNLIKIDDLKAIVKNVVDSAMIGGTDFTATFEDITGLANKIVGQVFLDGDYSEGLDDLSGFSAEFANTIEEYFENFVSPTDYDETGANALAPSRPTWQKPSYSSRCGRKVLKTTKDLGSIQKAFHSPEAYEACVNTITKRLFDSLELYLNEQRRGLLGFAADKLISVEKDTAFATSTAYVAGARVKGGVIVKDLAKASNTYASLSAAATAGYAVELDLSTTLAKPTDEATGEAFIESVKKYVEKFGKPQQGYSYNGNIAGKAPTYKLYIVEGIMPDIEVKTLAGAINEKRLGFGVEVVPVKNLGSSSAYALLIDPRGVRLHNAYRAVREQPNGEGDFINYYIHDDEIMFFSPNVMGHAWHE